MTSDERTPLSFATRVATVDIGTNTALLLVADVVDGDLVPVYEEDRYVRLGQGVDASRRLAPEAIERVLTALRAFAQKADLLGATDFVIGATSASRDAHNLDQLTSRVRDELGVEYGLLSGDEEALWSFRGACSAYPDLGAACVLDIGGGSTEIVAGPTDGEPERASVDVGSVRLTERCFPTLPPTDEMIADAERTIADAFGGLDFDTSLPLLGASGTTRALGRLANPVAPDAPISAETARAWRDRLLGLSASGVLALNPAVLEGRADVYAAGVLILDLFTERFGFASVRPSPRGLRHGLALRWAVRQTP